MTEPKKIRFTRDCIFGIKARDEFGVSTNGNEEFIIVHSLPFYLYLNQIEGWYEAVKWRPEPNGRYFRVTSSVSVEMCVRHGMAAKCERGIEVGNCYSTRRQAEAKAEQIRAIFKEVE